MRLTSEGWPWYKDRFIHKHIWPQDLSISMDFDPEGQWWEDWSSYEFLPYLKGDKVFPVDNSEERRVDYTEEELKKYVDWIKKYLVNLNMIDLDWFAYGNPLQYPNIRYWNLDDGDKDILTLVWDSEGSEGSEG